jgi:hypothetical protein
MVFLTMLSTSRSTCLTAAAARALMLAAAAAFLLPASAGLAAPRAHAARSAYIVEYGNLHLTSSHGLKLNEQGSASGSIRGSIFIHLTVSSRNGVSAEVNIYPSGGSLTGYGSAGYRVNGGYAEFSGNLQIVRGTGSFAHAHAHNLRFTGSIKRSNDSVNVKLSGTLYS